MADVAQLSWANKLAGAFFSILKSVLFLSVFILFLEKINGTNLFIAQETLDASIFYSPIKEFSSIVYPQIEEIYNSLTN
jgi:membrane protein required for colicin V production